MTTEKESSSSLRARTPGWIVSLPKILLGAAGGFAVNSISGDLGYSAIAFAALAAGLSFTVIEIRGLNPTAPRVSLASWALTVVSALTLIAAAFGPLNVQPTAILVAVAFAITSTLIHTSLLKAMTTLTGVTTIGGGVPCIGFGLSSGNTLFGVAIIGCGVAIIGCGTGILLGRDTLYEVATIGGGVAIIGFGVAVLLGGDTLHGVATIGAGVASIGCGMGFLLDGDTLFGVAFIGAGVAFIGFGVAVLLGGDTLSGVASIGGGVAIMGGGVADIGGGRLQLSRIVNKAREQWAKTAVPTAGVQNAGQVSEVQQGSTTNLNHPGPQTPDTTPSSTG